MILRAVVGRLVGYWPISMIGRGCYQLCLRLSPAYLVSNPAGALDKSGPWQPSNQGGSTPEDYQTFVMQPNASRMVPQFKSDFCGFYASLEIDQRFWWCN
jgi:hypothetical protein